MLKKSVSALFLLAVAGHAAASEPAPYKMVAKMSLNHMFGLARRQTSGYQPTQTICGTGATCAEACGTGFVQCASNDDAIHCFNPTVQQTCCPDGSGNSCDAGYFCTKDTAGETWCCPDGMTLAECAAAYSITGSLVSETAAPTSAPASSTGPISSGSHETITSDVETTVTTCPESTLSYGYNSTVSTAAPSSSVTTVVVSGASFVGPTAAMIIIAAAAVAVAF